MKAMIFAAGLGTRLKPLTDTLPKALVPVCGKPLIEHVARKLQKAGIDEAVVNQVADGAARREKPVMRRRRVFVAGERATQVVEDPLLERIDFRLGRRRDNFRLGGSFDGFNFYLGDRFFCFRCFCHYVFCFLCKN